MDRGNGVVRVGTPGKPTCVVIDEHGVRRLVPSPRDGASSVPAEETLAACAATAEESEPLEKG